MKRIFKFYTLILLMIISFFTFTLSLPQDVVAAVKDEPTDISTYYKDVNTSSGESLMTSLTTIISNGHKAVGYDGVKTSYKYTDINPKTGKIWDMYSNYNYSWTTNMSGGFPSEGAGYNREHSIPQSWFNEASPMKSDLFHVYPTDGYVNNRRGNEIYGEVVSATYTSGNGSKLGTDAKGRKVFEPIDEYKGDFARTYFYMATRYRTQVGSWDGNATQVFNKDYPYLTQYAEDLFVKWHEQDPVSEKEINRNDAVECEQGNRNPYIDHPEWVAVIWGDAEIEEQKYTVTYSVPSGTSFSYKDSTQYSANSLVTKPSNDPTLAGHTFDGWYTTASYTTKWDFNTSKITKNLTLYAKFIENDKTFEEIFVTKKILSQLTYGAEQTGGGVVTKSGTENVSCVSGDGAIGDKTGSTIDLADYMSFDQDLFSIQYVKNDSQHAYINNKQVRLYYASSGNGSSIEITAKEGLKITKIELEYASGSEKQLSGDEISISSDGSKAVLQNKATVNKKSYISKIAISYESKEGSVVNTLIDGTVK